MEVRRGWIVLAMAAWSLAMAGASNLGCLFSYGLCRKDLEWCYDDGAFGRCLQNYGEASAEDLYRHQLGKEELRALEREMERLMVQGYRWSHDHTQCIIQAMLYAFQTGTDFQRVICDRLKDQDLDVALKTLEGETEVEMDPRNMAYIRYTPSKVDPHADFADEVYFPPNRRPTVEMIDPVEPDFAVVRRSLLPGIHFSPKYNTPDGFRSGVEMRDRQTSPETNLEEIGEKEDTEGAEGDAGVVPGGFQRVYNTPDSFRRGFETRDMRAGEEGVESIRGEGGGEDVVGVPPEVQNDEETREEEDEEKRRLLMALATNMLEEREKEAGKGYTEGGLVFIPGKSKGEEEAYADLLDDLGFKRRERLDVKKPGPQFNTNNFAFQADSTQLPKPQKKEVDSKTSSPSEVTGDAENYDVVDTTVTYIEFQDSIRTWKEGSRIINTVAKLLHVPRSIFTHERVDRNEVTFRVEEPNAINLNASEVAKRIDDIKDELKKEIGVVVTASGIGDQAKVPVQVRLTQENDMYVAVVVACGVLAALALSATVLFFTRRHSSSKLQGLATSDTEPSKHYQDLCRARMSSKSQPEAASSAVAPPQRITSLSRESDNSPSSRSSTSSWSEEPALSNMDISTGHMVLAYMEDHLRNKDRLETEWTALCAYEADPCATTIAQRPENEKKNRYPNAVPYDHARVVLNELSNLTGSDFINASTITDHDPRNPAYIVTQGPLPHTAPDLWQMVWEQGCVVLVMLTRLVENDTAMCHRYWPEEGSELYHIYEVHLVSEHIWCDDYLVRSFYLKNLKTGETRTVTQFHFLSWPEGGVPASTKALLEFRRKVNKSFRGRSCPIVVHCSDGVGRSGTYCLLDMVLNRMAKGAKEIDIAATLEHIRDQRAGAVGTKQQFQLVLAAVAEEVQAILRVLPQQ